MKELSIEEKAKRYDEAIEIINDYYQKIRYSSLSCASNDIEVLEKAFPQLKESKDERIRKALLEMVHDTTGDSLWVDYNVHKEDAIAWLEKQGKNNMGISEATKQKLEDNLNKALEKETPESWNEFLDEQKPADKVESKFYEGDWVVNTVGDTNQVVKVFDDGYTLGDNTFLSNSWATEHYRLWTIQDAKDGDVLVKQNGEMPFIFKECKDNHIYCYCGYTNRKDIFFDRFINSEGEELHWLNLYHEYVYPATKEQRDLLFRKMREAGYEWDAEKKELKKISQRMVSAEAKEAMYNKAAWSEEDEKHIMAIDLGVNRCVGKWNCCGEKCPISEHSPWLKSLKDRYTWKPSEEQIDALEDAIADAVSSIQKNMLNSLYQDLQKLR